MIHQVKKSDEEFALLGQLVNLQLSLLRLAATDKILSASTSVRRGNVEVHLEESYADQAHQVASWVTNKPTLLETLNQFAAHDKPDEKQAFVADLEADVKLIYNPEPERLRVAITGQTPDWQRAAGDFCGRFYELFSARCQSKPVRYGFQAFLFTDPTLTRDSFNRWDFVDAFTRSNPILYLCAICDATAYRATIDSRAYTSIEHFFPKSIYPHLSIHPYNLIPICTYCNSGAARSIDPLDYCSEELGLRELLLPYQDGHEGLSQQAYIKVGQRSGGAEAGMHPLELHLQPATEHEAQRFIDSFERIYRVEERWNKDLDQIDQHVFRRITQFLAGDVQLGNALSDVGFVVDRLELLMALTDQDSLGRDPFAFATVWLLKHHIDCIQLEREEAAVFRALKSWAEEQQERWTELRDHFKKLLARVETE